MSYYAIFAELQVARLSIEKLLITVAYHDQAVFGIDLHLVARVSAKA